MQPISFPPFRLDPANERLWRDDAVLTLRPKSFAVLRYLAERPQQLVTKDELLRAVWPDTYVSDVVLKVCVNEVRRVLDDTARPARVIETVHRRGYRFVAGLAAPAAEAPPSPSIVGRDAELARLERALADAEHGHRQLVFVSGEAGIGKTALVDAFVARILARGTPSTCWLARGQCVAQYGIGEAFLPVLDALGRLGRQPDGGHVVAVLRELAPEWLAQLPALVDPADRDALARQARRTAPNRMLRAMVEALDALAAERPVVLVLEDLHWADHSTLDLVARVAARPDPARLLVVATYRPSDAIVHGHPLRPIAHELAIHGRCIDMPVGFLAEPDVAGYLARRFPGMVLPPGLARWVCERSDGNPLFMVAVVDELVAQGLVARIDGRPALRPGFERVGIPEGLRAMIERRLERLGSDDQALLEVASVAGATFAVAAAAAGLASDPLALEDRCVAIVRRGQFLTQAGPAEWPDGTVTARFAFTHVLYRDALYARIGPARRIALHRRIGDRLETAYGARRADVAGELAVHFECARDRERAVECLHELAGRAIAAGAHHDAATSLTHALALLEELPDIPERAPRRLALQLAYGQSVIAARGYAHPEVAEAFGRVRAMSERMGLAVPRLLSLGGLATHYLARADAAGVRRTASELVDLAERSGVPGAEDVADCVTGTSQFQLGELQPARVRLERMLARPDRAPLGFIDVRTHAVGVLAPLLVLLGRPGDARRREAEAIGRARAAANAFDLASALVFACIARFTVRDTEASLQMADEAFRVASDHGFPMALGAMRAARALLRAQAGGADALDELDAGVAAYRAGGAIAWLPVFSCGRAEVLFQRHRVDEAARAVDEAIASAESASERSYLADLLRLKGEILLAQAATRGRRRGDDVAEACFDRAAAVARRQDARWWLLRLATTVCRLRVRQGRADEGRALVVDAIAGIADGDDTADVRQARALVAAIGG